MKFSNLCPFCLNSRLKNNNIINLPAEDSILYENNYFYVVVDIAPLMRGHLLIIPKKHYLNFGELPEDMKKEAKIIKKKIKKIYQDVYNSDALFFEHGSTDDISAGSSINHAHLHSLPLDIDLLPILDDNFPLKENADILEKKISKMFPYIYLETAKIKVIYNVENITSQYMRLVISEQLGKINYKWQVNCLTKKSQKDFYETIEDLKGKFNF